MNGPGAVVPDRSVFDLPEGAVPGGVYLCQVSEKVSCGACCGLYNRTDVSRETLRGLLHRRTRRFRKTPRTAAAIDAFRAETECSESAPGPYPDFYHCPFLGLVGNPPFRVGCLLHPVSDGNAGIDFRGLSFYGGLACRGYFCPSHRHLSAARKRIVKAVCTHWHLYGLVISDPFFVDAVLSAIEHRLERPVREDDILKNAEAAAAIQVLFNFKLHWPFRPAGWKGPGTYFFNDAADSSVSLDYEKPGAASSVHNALFLALASEFTSPSALNAAEKMVMSAVSRVVRRIQRKAPDRVFP